MVAKKHSSKKSSTNFLVTHIKSVTDLRKLLTDESTYGDEAAVVEDEADDDVVETGSDGADAEIQAPEDDAGETIEIEEVVDDDDDDEDRGDDDNSRGVESSDGSKTRNSVERKVAKKSTAKTTPALKRVRAGKLSEFLCPTRSPRFNLYKNLHLLPPVV